MVKHLNIRFVETVKPGPTRIDYYDDDKSGFGLRVTTLGQKSWTLFYRFNGKQERLILGKYPALGLADARQIARQRLGDIARGVNPAAERRAAAPAVETADNRNDDTFEALALLYLERYAKLEKRSWRQDESAIRRLLLPAWGSRKAADIRRRDVVDLLEDIARDSPVMANRVQSLISKIFNFGVDREAVDVNPALKMHRRKEDPRQKALSQDEICAVWTALSEESYQTAAIVKLLFLTGTRPNEVCNLAWSELDLEKGWWTLPKERAKNGRSYRIPLSREALIILSGMLPREGALVFRKRITAGRIWTDTQLERIKKNSGVDFQRKDIRTTFTSRLAEMGVRGDVLDELTNHARIGITNKVYNHYNYDKEKREVIAKWDLYLRQLTTGLHAVSA